MSRSDTQTRIIETARLLFAKKGVDDITMNEIAETLEIGRRTLYTYFRCKEDLFWAVVRNEQEKITRNIAVIVKRELPADEKIIEMIYMRLRSVRDVVMRNGNLRASFFRDIWMVERVRKEFDKREIEMFEEILDEGNRTKIFQIEHVDLLAEFFHYCIKGLEVPFIRGKIGKDLSDSEVKRYVRKMVFTVLGRKKEENDI